MPKDVDAEPRGAILEHLPYRKRDGTIVRDQYNHPWFAGHGYVCIRTDMRGTGESEGITTDEYTQQEFEDAIDVMNWIAEQSWSNGNVGMMGISWGGFNGLQVAALAPTPLKAVISLCSTVDRYADDIHYKGGCLLGENFGWSMNMLAYSSRPPDPDLAGNCWHEMWMDRLDKQVFHLSDWLRHQHRDEYWEHGSICEDYSALKAPVLSIGGWHDGYRNTISHIVENLETTAKGIVGPWNHKYPHYAGPKPAIGFLQEAKRWWDKWLMGSETGVEKDPDYRAYLMDSLAPKRWFDERPGHWIAEDVWPSPNIKTVNLTLGADGVLGANLTAPLTVSSAQDCGSAAGEYFPFNFGDELPDEQSSEDEKSLCFTGDPIDTDWDIVGAPSINLTMTSDQPTGLIAVRLNDVRPDGQVALITYGLLNLTHKKSHKTPAALIVGETFDVELILDQCAYRLPKGHKLRVAISNTYWPTVWPSAVAGKLTVESGSISVPQRPHSEGAECSFEEPQAASPWNAKVRRPSDYSRETFTDEDTGDVVTEMFCDFGENEDGEHGLISGGWMREEWTIHPDDPLSAHATQIWEHTGGRDGQMWRTMAVGEMWCDEEKFYISARLTAYENEAVVFERDYEDEVARDLV
jgi:putative CocE/NonD family hydrolase